jgi:hypothetical protein
MTQKILSISKKNCCHQTDMSILLLPIRDVSCLLELRIGIAEWGQKGGVGV